MCIRDSLVRKWRIKFHIGIKVNSETILNTLLHADDQLIMQETEDNLQRTIHKLNHHLAQYNLKLFINKIKVKRKGTKKEKEMNKE